MNTDDLIKQVREGKDPSEVIEEQRIRVGANVFFIGTKYEIPTKKGIKIATFRGRAEGGGYEFKTPRNIYYLSGKEISQAKEE